jgi:hypothetical protein
MKQKPILIGVIAFFFAIGGYISYRVLSSRKLSPEQTVTYTYQGLDIKLVYCSPFKRGRVIFGEGKDVLLPYNKYWRMGANEATEITFSKAVNFMGKPLEAGSYRMYAVPGDSVWTISLNSELGKWGYDEPNYNLDVLKVAVPVSVLPTITEQFTMAFSNDSSAVNMNIDWDKIHLSVPIQSR